MDKIILRVLNRHEKMLSDARREAPLQKAIKKTIKPGDVVLDIGTGTGVLAFAACKAGARRVYAIDVDASSLGVAIFFAKRHKIADKIIFIEGLSFHAMLPEKVDVIICETVGSAGFDENILATLKDAKKKLLKPGGKIIPKSIELWGALSCNKSAPYSFISKPSQLISVDTAKNSSTKIHIRSTHTTSREGKMNCAVIWHKTYWDRTNTTDCSPFLPPTHWKQTVLPIKPIAAKKGEKYRFELIIRPDPKDPLIKTEILWKVAIL